MSATAEKPTTKIRRTERLPSDWAWHNNMAVKHKTETNADGSPFIVYLTTGMRSDKNIAFHLSHVLKARRSAEIQNNSDL